MLPRAYDARPAFPHPQPTCSRGSNSAERVLSRPVSLSLPLILRLWRGPGGAS